MDQKRVWEPVRMVEPGTYCAILSGFDNAGVTYGQTVVEGQPYSVSFKLAPSETRLIREEFNKGRSLRVSFVSDGTGVRGDTGRMWLNATPGTLTPLSWVEAPGIHQILGVGALGDLPSEIEEL